MEITRNWLLPTLLALGQIALLPANESWLEQPLDRVELGAVIAATALTAVALAWRRRAPVAALVGVTAAITLGSLAASLDALALIGLADAIALYSIGVRRPTPVLAWATTGLVGWQAVLCLTFLGTTSAYVGTVLASALAYLLAAGLGRSRRRWLAVRRSVAERLAQAEAEQRQAASAERRRLARELHDISAHHLTSIVVTAGAAQRLADRQPALVAEALEFAARTGRETLTALHRLVAVLRTADRDETMPVDGRLESLAAGFARLGQPVTVNLPPDLPTSGAIADALFGITREALTNALRYAPGSTVHVTVRRVDAGLELVVDDDGAVRAAADRAGIGASGGGPSVGSADAAADSSPGSDDTSLGSGLGLGGARDRAAAAGGTFTAGPKPSGGWRVCAVLPDAPAVDRGHGGGRLALVREQRFTDWAIALAVAVLPLAGLLAVNETNENVDPAAGALLALLIIGHGLPLLWRRNAAWLAFVGVLATTWLWPVAVWYSVLPPPMAVLLGLSCLAEFAVVYAVAAYARPKWATWLCVPPAAGSFAAALTTALAADGSLAGEPVRVPEVVVFSVFLAVAFAVLLAATWVVGFAVRLRRERVLAREDTALTHVAAEASAATHAERLRIAAGLRQAVLHRASRVVTVAEEGRSTTSSPKRGQGSPPCATCSVGCARTSRQRGAIPRQPPQLSTVCVASTALLGETLRSSALSSFPRYRPTSTCRRTAWSRRCSAQATAALRGCPWWSVPTNCASRSLACPLPPAAPPSPGCGRAQMRWAARWRSTAPVRCGCGCRPAEIRRRSRRWHRRHPRDRR